MALVNCNGIDFSYGSTPLIKGFDLQIHENELICLRGPNGIGKSTLLDLIAGDLEPAGGRIDRRPDLVIRYLPQGPQAFGRLTCRETASLAIGYQTMDCHSWRLLLQEVPSSLIRNRLERISDTMLWSVSGGERQALFLSMVLALASDIYLLDEPFAAMDDELQTAFLDWIARRLDSGAAALISTHDPQTLAALADRHIRLFHPDGTLNMPRLLPLSEPEFIQSWPAALRFGVAVSLFQGPGRISGSAVGDPYTATRSGAGEYLERTVLFTRIRPTHQCRLDEIGPPALSQALIEAISQLVSTPVLPADHEFLCTRCRNLLTGEPALYPTALLSLARVGLEADRALLPVVDSSGSGLHQTPERARASALCEFLERQMLVATWRGLRCSELRLDTPRLPPPIAAAMDLLEATGRLRAFTAACPVGGSYVVAVFSGESGPVKYSIGSAFALNPEQALVKALEELWHGVIYQFRNVDRPLPRGMDSMAWNFLSSNHAETSLLFPFVMDPHIDEISHRSFVSQPEPDIACLLDKWPLISATPLVFEVSHENHHFCRVVDPNFHAHMNTGARLNFTNRFATWLGLAAPDSGRRRPIPFP